MPWTVVGSGGGHAASATYSMDATAGQPIVSAGTSSGSYSAESGFWVQGFDQSTPTATPIPTGTPTNTSRFIFLPVVMKQ